MLTVHHLGISQSERIVWLCEELEIPYNLVRYDRDPVSRMAPAEYKALHPAQMAPVIMDGDLNLAESGAIIEYIIARYGSGRLAVPPSAPNFPDYLFWLHFANGTLMPGEMSGMIAGALGVPDDHSVMGMVKARGERAYAMVEKRLGEVPYLAGKEFTAADIINFFPFTTMRAFSKRDLSAYPNVKAWLKRVGDRPAYRRAMAKGDPGLPLMVE